MKKLTSHLIVFLFIALSCNIQSQTSPIFAYIADINTQMANIPYVFEGQIQSVKIFAGDENGNPIPNTSIVWNGGVGYWHMPNGKRGYGYSLTTIKVCKTYKGNIPNPKGDRTFQVLTRCYALNNVYRMKKGAATEDKYTYIPAQHTMAGRHEEKVFQPANAYPRQLFFCDRIDPIVGANYNNKLYYSNFHSLYEMSFDVPVRVSKPDGSATFVKAYSTLFNYVFANQAELELFLSQINGVNPRPTNYCPVILSKQDENEPEIEDVKINYESNLNNYKTRMESLDNLVKVRSNSVNNKSAFIDNLNLGIVNERLVKVGADNWFEFDVMVSSNNSSLFFDNCLMRIQYNSAVFGSNVVAGSNVLITRATAYNTITYINPQTNVIDQNSNTIGIPFGTDFSVSTWNRVQHTTTPSKMLTVRLKILTCGQNVNLLFVDQATTSNLSFYANTANASIVNTTAFNATNYTGNITDKACEPIITGFTDNIPAGIGSQMTITGKYFGANMGTGTVIFKDADIGTTYPNYSMGVHSSGIQPYDVVTWADNQIVITLPSIIDSAYSYQITSLGPVPYGPTRVTPGTGKFFVQNFTGTIKESATPFKIPYSHSNVIAPNVAAPIGAYRKKPIKLSSPTSSGYKIQIDPTVNTYNSIMKAVMRRAMKDWECFTHINWYMGADGAAGVVGNDNINQVTMGTSSMTPGTLMETLPSVMACVVGGVETWYLSSFDMIINPTPPQTWWCDTTGSTLPALKYDFYQCVTHELGHAHLLNHINDSLADVLFWQQPAFTVSGGPRKNLYSSVGSVRGGTFVTTNLIGGLSCVGNHVLTTSSPCAGSLVDIKRQTNSLLNLSVYPNPSSIAENLTIEFNLEKEEVVSFTLYGVAGNLIKQTLPEKLSQSINYTFDTGSINAGMYILVIKVGNKQQTVKIIKQ
jgi:hypothetical protein